MMNHTNKNIDVSADVEHLLAISFNTTLKEINEDVWNKVFDIVCYLNNKYE